MKGMMVALLACLFATFCSSESNAQDKGVGKFVLELDDALIEQLKTNPEGLIAHIDEAIQGSITDVVVKYKAPDQALTANNPPSTLPNGQMVAKPQVREDQNSGGFQSQPTSRGDASTRRTQFGAQESIMERTPTFDRTPTFRDPSVERRIADNNPQPQPWIAIGDDTDFVPVVRRDNLVTRPKTEIPNGFGGMTRLAHNEQNVFPRQEDNGLANFRAGNGQRQIEQRQPVTGFAGEADLRKQLQDERFATLKTQQEIDELKRQNQQLMQMIQNAQAQNQQQPVQNQNPAGFGQQNPNQTQQIAYQTNPNPFYVMPIANPSYQFPNRYPETSAERDLENPSLPNRRVASRNEVRPKTSSLNEYTTQIPGPNSKQDSPSDATQLGKTNLTNPELAAKVTNLSKTNGFLLFMLLCSVGINIYLGLISRSFYTRYAELADELRETFTATM